MVVLELENGFWSKNLKPKALMVVQGAPIIANIPTPFTQQAFASFQMLVVVLISAFQLIVDHIFNHTHPHLLSLLLGFKQFCFTIWIKTGSLLFSFFYAKCQPKGKTFGMYQGTRQVKIIVDAAWIERTHTTGLRIVAWDSDGMVLGGRVQRHSTWAEAYAVVLCLTSASDMAFREIGLILDMLSFCWVELLVLGLLFVFLKLFLSVNYYFLNFYPFN